MADYVVGSPALFNEDAKFFKDVYIYGKLYYDFESFPGIIRFGNITATSFSGSGSLSVSGTVSGSNITSGGNVTGNSATATTTTNLSGGTLTNYAETINAIGNTGTAATINLANGNFVTATLTGNCTWTFTTEVTSGAVSFTLVLTNDATAGRTITWPISVKWPGGTISTRTTTASRTDVYTFFTTDNGTNWYGNIAQYNYA